MNSSTLIKLSQKAHKHLYVSVTQDKSPVNNFETPTPQHDYHALVWSYPPNVHAQDTTAEPCPLRVHIPVTSSAGPPRSACH